MKKGGGVRGSGKTCLATLFLRLSKVVGKFRVISICMWKKIKTLKSFNCKICGKTFANKYSAVRHINTVHFLERRFCCPFCKAGFKQKSHLNKHKRISCRMKISKCTWNWLKNWKVLFHLNELLLNCKKQTTVSYSTNFVSLSHKML